MAEPSRPRVPPHSVEAEQSLLGGIMLPDAKAWPRVAPLVTQADFFRADHRLIFEAIAAVVELGQAPDAVTVREHLQRKGQLEAAGDRDYIAQLVEDAPSGVNCEAYASIVREHAMLRRLLEVSQQIARSVHERGDRRADELLGDASNALLQLQSGARVGRGLVESRELVSELLDDLDRRRDGHRGVSIGLGDFDQLTGGAEPGDLIVIAGRPGLGKTALLVSIAAHVSQSTGVAVFSAEMPSSQLTRRCVALLGGVSQGRLRRAETLTDEDWAAIDNATGALAARHLLIDDTPAPSLTHIRAEVLALRTRDLGLVAVDYVQLVEGRGANRYEQLRDVAYGLKGLAKEASVPIILLAQLNRGVETRAGDRRPRLSDLRDSGSIEEAADIVALLFSEGYYNTDFGMPFVLECQVEKNRNGERGLCLWRFAGEHSRVTVLEPGVRDQYLHLLRPKARRSGADDDL